MGFKFLEKYSPQVCETCENVVDEGATVGGTSVIYLCVGCGEGWRQRLRGAKECRPRV